jgi:hypothetical protein
MNLRIVTWPLTFASFIVVACLAATAVGAGAQPLAANGTTPPTVEVGSAARGPDCSYYDVGEAWFTLRDGMQVCPHQHSLFADGSLTGLRWSSWGLQARAKGYLSCEGSGCQGRHPTRIDIELSRVRNCPNGGDGLFMYTRYDEWSRFGHFGYAISCNGDTGGAGNG